MGLTTAQDSADPIEKIIAVGVVPENLPTLDSPDDDEMQRPRCINSGFARHEIQIVRKQSGLNIKPIYVL
jgi:hypothetical protein